LIIRVGISKLEIEMFIGILDTEIKNKQSVLIDIECILSDLKTKIEETFDYRIFKSICTKLANVKKYDLLETFAKDILEELKIFSIIKSVKLKINKLSAIQLAESAYIEIEQSL
jgi:FolB domain-containing protein